MFCGCSAAQVLALPELVQQHSGGVRKLQSRGFVQKFGEAQLGRVRALWVSKAYSIQEFGRIQVLGVGLHRLTTLVYSELSGSCCFVLRFADTCDCRCTRKKWALLDNRLWMARN